MFNIFQQPWTILVIAFITLDAIWFAGMFKTEKIKKWIWLTPLLIALLGFAIDFLIKTDREKINILINSVIKATQEENIPAIDAIIANDYHDSAHQTKRDLMRYCKRMLSAPFIEKNTKMGATLEITPPTAKATLTVMTRFDPNSFVYQNNIRIMIVKVELFMQKQPDKSWLIQQTELLEINKQPMTWRQVN